MARRKRGQSIERVMRLSCLEVRQFIDGGRTQLRLKPHAQPRPDSDRPGCYLLLERGRPMTWVSNELILEKWSKDRTRRLAVEHRRLPLREFMVSECPYRAGDKLFIQETWFQPYTPSKAGPGILYLADGPDYVRSMSQQRHQCRRDTHSWKSATTLRKEHCRLVLTVTEVRAQMLREMRDVDAEAEGIVPRMRPKFTMDGFGYPDTPEDECSGTRRAALLRDWMHRLQGYPNVESTWTWVLQVNAEVLTKYTTGWS